MTKHTATNRNCFQCCVAGIFDKQLSEVPDIMEFKADDDMSEQKGWYNSFYLWSIVVLNHIPVVVTDDNLEALIHIDIFENMNGVTHATINKGDEVLWNPGDQAMYPTNKDSLYKILFVPKQEA